MSGRNMTGGKHLLPDDLLYSACRLLDAAWHTKTVFVVGGDNGRKGRLLARAKRLIHLHPQLIDCVCCGNTEGQAQVQAKAAQIIFNKENPVSVYPPGTTSADFVEAMQ